MYVPESPESPWIPDSRSMILFTNGQGYAWNYWARKNFWFDSVLNKYTKHDFNKYHFFYFWGILNQDFGSTLLSTGDKRIEGLLSIWVILFDFVEIRALVRWCVTHDSHDLMSHMIHQRSWLIGIWNINAIFLFRNILKWL